MQPTILEFMLHEPPVTDTTGTQISEDDIDMSLNPEKAGWLRKLGEVILMCKSPQLKNTG